MKTQIAVVLDRSGSMGSCLEPTITGFNEFLKKQKTETADADFLLIQFDNEFLTTYNGPIKDAPELSTYTFVPRGSTALNDAQGRTIDELGNKLSALSSTDRPENVIVVIMTDGGENASKNYTRKKVADMIKHQQDKYNWKFLFIGANQDAVATGQSYNIPAGSSLTYSIGAMNSTFAVASSYVTRNSRGSGEVKPLTNEERKQALGVDLSDKK